MPRRGRSGIPNLYKKHSSGCRNRDPLKCDCSWYGKYKRVNVNLAAGRVSSSTRAGVSTRAS